jgi:FkbM family methyltransferase
VSRAEQLGHLQEAIRHCQSFRHAIDVGAFSGQWSLAMAERFARVTAFEPLPRAAKRWRRRMAGTTAILHEIALADRPGSARMAKLPTSKPYIVRDRCGDVRVETLDSFGFDDVDLLKIDAEGADALIIAGAQETIRRCRPVMIVEHIPEWQRLFGLAADAVPQAMARLEYRLVATLWPDLVFVP